MRTLILCLALLVFAVSKASCAEPPEAVEPTVESTTTLELVEDFGQLKETFYQRIDVQRAPQFIVQGLRTGQQIQYHISSLFKVYETDDEGYHKVVQVIESTKLAKADAMSRSVFANSLTAMVGRSLTYTVTESGEILSVDGYQPTVDAVDIDKPQSKGLLVTSVLDKDGWKELAELTLFQPTEGKPRKSFSRKTTHDWGSLGSWYGETNFKAHSKRPKPKQYDYQHKLDYIAPGKHGAAPSTIMGLPFAIDKAKFRMEKGSGQILYNHKLGHATAIRERFHATGRVSTTMLGRAMTIAIDEKQIFDIKISGYQRVKQPQPKQESLGPSADRESTSAGTLPD